VSFGEENGHQYNVIDMFNGKIVHQQVGALPEPVLRDLVQQFLEVVKDFKNQ